MAGSEQLPFSDDRTGPDPGSEDATAVDAPPSDEGATAGAEGPATGGGDRVDAPARGPTVGSLPPVRPAPPRSFQASAGIQGRQFAEQCDTLLGHLGYQLRGRRLLTDLGVEIDQEAVGPGGTVVWFEYKGSVQGNRPGLRRTDTVKKAVANGALLRALDEPSPYVVITSHLPAGGAAAAMLRAAEDLGYVADVVCLYDPAATARLKRW